MTLVRRALLLSVLFIPLGMAPTKPIRVLFFGDSITQLATKPNGYIIRLNEMLAREGKSADYELIGSGVGGNKIYDLYLRMENDVLARQPDITVIYIGVNDVWHKRTFGTGTDADKFVEFYETIIKKLQAANSQVILCTPAVIGEKTDFSNEQDGDLNRYTQLIRDLATRYKLPLCDLRKTFLDYNLKNNLKSEEKGILTTDRVHLNDLGNQLVAEQLYKHISKK